MNGISSTKVTSRSKIPEGYILSSLALDKLGYREYNRIHHMISHKRVSSIRLIGSKGAKGSTYILPESFSSEVGDGVFTEMIKRLIAMRDGHLTSEMKKEAMMTWNQFCIHRKGISSNIQASVAEVESLKLPEAVVASSESIAQATPDGIEENSRAERAIKTFERLATLQEKLIAVAEQNLIAQRQNLAAMQRIEAIWS